MITSYDLRGPSVVTRKSLARTTIIARAKCPDHTHSGLEQKT